MATNANLACSNPTSSTVQVTSLFSAATDAAFSFSVNSVLSPPTTADTYSLTVESYFSTTGNSRIDRCTAAVEGLTALPLTIISSSTNSALVSQSTALRMIFNFGTNNLAVDDVLTFTFPATLQTSVTQLTSFDFTLSPGANQAALTCINPISSASYQFALNTITMPPSILPSDPILVRASRGGFPFLSGSFTVTAVIRPLTLAVTSTVTEIGRSGTMTFAITLATAISSTGRVRITFPSSLQVSASQTCSGSGGSLASTPTCSLTGSTLTISALASEGQPAGTYTFGVISVTNPSTTVPVTGFDVSVLYSDVAGSLMASVVGGTFTPTAAQLDGSLITVTPTSRTVNNIETGYTVAFTLKNSLPTNSVVALTIPACVVVNSGVVSNNCAARVGTGSQQTTSCSAAAVSADGSLTVTFPSIFTSSSAAAGTVLELAISSSFTNPSST